MCVAPLCFLHPLRSCCRSWCSLLPLRSPCRRTCSRTRARSLGRVHARRSDQAAPGACVVDGPAASTSWALAPIGGSRSGRTRRRARGRSSPPEPSLRVGETVNVGSATQASRLARPLGRGDRQGRRGADALRRARWLQRNRRSTSLIAEGVFPERCGLPGERLGCLLLLSPAPCSARASHASSRGRRPAWCRRARAR